MNIEEIVVEPEDIIIAAAQGQWCAELPDQPLPDETAFYVWLHKAGGSAGILRHAINRLGKRHRINSQAGQEMSGEDCERYLTSVIVSEIKILEHETSVSSTRNDDSLTIRSTGSARKRTRNRVGVRKLG